MHFDHAYVSNWVAQAGSVFHVAGHIPFQSYFLGPRSAILLGSALAGPAPPRNRVPRRFSRSMNATVPLWLWQRMFFAAHHYCLFYSQLWPDLVNSVLDMIYLEWLLHLEPGNPRYRDHLFHMFKVACFGTFLLDDGAFAQEVAGHQFAPRPAGSGLRDCDAWVRRRFPALVLTNDDRVLIVRWAYLLAAFFHDLGYGHAFRGVLDARVGDMHDWMSVRSQNSEPSMRMQRVLLESLLMDFVRAHSACDNTRRWPDEYPAVRRATGFVRDTLELNHSTASSLLVLHLCDLLRESRTMLPHFQIALEIAAEAVLIHDMKHPDGWCGLRSQRTVTADPADPDDHFLHRHSCEEVPVAVLLMLCDELDVLDRPRMAPRPPAKPEELILKLAVGNTAMAVAVEMTPGGLDVDVKALPAVLPRIRDGLRDTLNGHPALCGEFFGRPITVP